MTRLLDYRHEWSLFAAVLHVVFIHELSCIGVTASFPTSSLSSSAPAAIPKVATCSQVCRYEEYYRRAHCDQRSLYFIPASIGCEDVMLLELQGNNITTITTEQITQYTHVKTLDISSNQIASLDSGTFSNNQELRNIIASHNKLQVLQSGTFNGTENTLTRIFLDYNEFQNIEEKAFQGLGKVTVLYLNNNRFKYLPINVFNDLVRLTRLSLGNNSLLEIEKDCFRNLTKLQILRLDGNSLTKIPAGLFDGLHDLKEVNLSNNRLNTIPPPEVLGFHHLQVFDLTNNNLRQSELIAPFLLNVTDIILFGENPYPCDCGFQNIQNWFYHEISDSKQTSLSTGSPVGCTTDNGTFVPIQSNVRLNCDETDKSTTSQPLKSKVTPTLKFEKERKDSEIHTTLDKEQDNSIQDVEGGKLPVDYKSAWVSYYTAVILTLYVIIRIGTWLVKRRKKSTQ